MDSSTIIFLGGVLLFGFYIYRKVQNYKKKYVCTTCEHIGTSKTQVRGSTGVELVLWLCFLIPGLIYSIWRSSSRHQVCPVCGNESLVPASTPAGKRIVSKHEQEDANDEK